MTPEELEELERLLLLELRETPIVFPNPRNIPQLTAFNSEAEEIGYGGAAGGGKSFTALLLAIRKHYRSLIIRKNYESLAEFGVMARSIFNPEDDSNIQANWVSGGENSTALMIRPKPGYRGVSAKRIKCTHLSHIGSGLRFQGNTSDLIVYDECTDFPESIIDYSATWLRATSGTPKGQKMQLVLTFNPPGTPEALWVIARFAPWIDDEHPLYPVPYGQLMHRIRLEGENLWFEQPTLLTKHPTTKAPLEPSLKSVPVTFIKALVTDNEFQSEDYINRLAQNPDAVMVARMLRGNMKAMLTRDDSGAIIKIAAYKRAVTRWKAATQPDRLPDVISIDPALTSDTCVFTPIWTAEQYIGRQTRIPGAKIGSEAENIVMQLFAAFPQAELSTIVVDALGPSGPISVSKIKAAILARNPSGTVWAFKGNDGTNWKGYCPPELPNNNAKIKFNNKISAAWVTLGQRLEVQSCEICIPPDSTLESQLLGRRIKTMEAERMTIESKEDYKKRLNGYSPDSADSLIMGYWFVFYEQMHLGTSAWTPQTV